MGSLNNKCEQEYCECDKGLVKNMIDAAGHLGKCPKNPGCSHPIKWNIAPKIKNIVVGL